MVGNDNVGHDLTQETFWKVWKSLSTLREVSLFKSWLYRIARNTALNYQRHLKHLPQISLDMYSADRDGDVLSVPGPEEGIAQSELIQLALHQVSPIYRSALILYVCEGLSQREVAERLNIKETGIGKYISRGKEQLRQNYYRLLSEQRSVLPKRRNGRANE
jgi:RNA polymerase sigma-70 factor (ECF subfamily)